MLFNSCQILNSWMSWFQSRLLRATIDIMKNKTHKHRLHLHKIAPLLGQLLQDLRPSPERIKIRVKIEEVSKKDIADYCREKKDGGAYEKMAEHELPDEPVETIIAISRPSDEKIEKKYIEKVLSDLGYNLHVLFSKNHDCDWDAAVNVNGYYIPGWNLLIKFLRRFNRGLAIFLGKRFAPGRSRLHIRIFEGKNTWYIISHIDKFNWLNFNLRGVIRSHIGSGQGDYISGTKYFLESLKYYFNQTDQT